MSDTTSEPPLTRIEVWVCDPCLAGEGGECHTPGCGFWIWPGPTGDQLCLLRSWASVTQPRPADPSPVMARIAAEFDRLVAEGPPR